MRRTRESSRESGVRRSGWMHAMAAAALLAAVACSPPVPSGAPASRESGAGAMAEAPEFQRLRGRWERADGGYVLEIRSVSADGGVDAAYLNPRPIHVAQAEASRQGGVLSLFVELQDVNYPGSSYNLGYDAARDVLEGTYFQAVEKQTFDVSFVRR